MKKTKRIISVITALVLTASNVFAADAVQGIELTTQYTKTVKEGTFKSFEDGQLLLSDGKRDFAINTDENTLFINSDAKKSDISSVKAGSEFTVVADSAQTRSIPPQSYGYVIIEEVTEKVPFYIEVSEINNSEITSADNKYIIRALDTAEITSFETGNKLTANDIATGSKLLVYSDIMTMSIPAQVPADKIIVLNHTENEAVSEPIASYNKTVMTGTFKSFADNQLLISDEKRDFAINTDKNTLFINSDAKEIDMTAVTVGTELEIIADSAQTRSIPPQSHGYVIIVKTSEKMPFYVEVSEIENNEILSADNEYIIRALDTADIRTFGTNKQLTASDIKKDSKLLVYSDIMTMSIPAQVPADKIIVLDAEDKPEVSTENVIYYLQRLIKALGFEGIFYK